jgi:hypothetical protein
MYIFYESAACALAASIGAGLLFTVCVIFLALLEGCSIVVKRSRRLTPSGAPLEGRWLAIE